MRYLWSAHYMGENKTFIVEQNLEIGQIAISSI
jgi:hypothetical protein